METYLFRRYDINHNKTVQDNHLTNHVVITSSRRLYVMNILISECNNKLLYCRDKSHKFKLALIKVCTWFMVVSFFNLIKCSSLSNIFSSIVNLSLRLFT